MSLIDLRKTNTESPHTLRLLSFILQYTTAVNVLTNVATIAGAIIPAGFTLPYWLLYAIIFTGINCREEIFKIKNVHISLLAIRSCFPFFPPAISAPPLVIIPSACIYPGFPLSSSSFASSSIALSPPCVKLVTRTY